MLRFFLPYWGSGSYERGKLQYLSVADFDSGALRAMRSEQRDLVVPVGISDVYDFLIDYSHDRLWREELAGVTLVSGTLGVPGAVYETESEWNGLKSRARIELVDCERPSRIHFRSAEPGATVDSVYRMEADGDQTRLQVEFTLDSKGSFLLVEPFSWAILTRWADAGLPRLVDAIESWSHANRLTDER